MRQVVSATNDAPAPLDATDEVRRLSQAGVVSGTTAGAFGGIAATGAMFGFLAPWWPVALAAISFGIAAWLCTRAAARAASSG